MGKHGNAGVAQWDSTLAAAADGFLLSKGELSNALCSASVHRTWRMDLGGSLRQDRCCARYPKEL